MKLAKSIARPLGIGLIATACIAAPAVGQERVGGDGRLLERNLQVGSGGYNGPRVRNTYGRYADALVTGNAGGLHNFRGNLDYRAAGEFSERTALDDTFGFRQRSIAPILLSRRAVEAVPGSGALLGRPGYDQRAYRSGWLVVRSGGGATVGEVTGQSRRYDLGGPVRRDDAVTPRLGGGDQRQRDQALESTRLGAAGRDDLAGRLLQVTASPLLGVRVTGVPIVSDRMAAPVASPGRATPGQAGAPPAEAAPSQPPDRLPPGSVGARAVGQDADSVGRRFAGDGSVGAATDTGDTGAPILRPYGWTSVKPGTDVHHDLLRRARGPMASETADKLPNHLGATKPEPPAGAADIAAVRAAALERVKAEQATARQLDRRRRVDQLMQKLILGRPIIDTLAAPGTGDFDQRMAQAEKLMRDGQYFDAETAYGQALEVRADHPLARIGQFHAQLGAGLHVAAGISLRRLCLDHPELIAGRYVPPAIPPAQRLNESQAALIALAAGNRESSAYLLLAYIGHQREDQELVGKSLDAMARQDADDLLVPLLRRAWLARPRRIEK